MNLADLERLVNEGKIGLGDAMRELRMFNDHLPEISQNMH